MSCIVLKQVMDDESIDISKIINGLKGNPLNIDWVITFKDYPYQSMHRGINQSSRLVSILDFSVNKSWWSWSTSSIVRSNIFAKYDTNFHDWHKKSQQHVDIICQNAPSSITLGIAWIISNMIFGDAPHKCSLSEETIAKKYPYLGVNDNGEIKVGCVACIFDESNKYWLLKNVSLQIIEDHMCNDKHLGNVQKLKSKFPNTNNVHVADLRFNNTNMKPSFD